MALIHVKSTGTRLVASGSPSDAGDWTDANCYPYSALDSILNIAEDDAPAVVIFDDEDVTLPAAWSLNNFQATNASTLRIESRSGGTVLRPANATTRILQKNNDTNTDPRFSIKGITFAGPADGSAWTSNNALVLFGSETQSVELIDCTFRDIDFTGSSTSAPRCLQVASNEFATTVDITNLTVRNVTCISTENSGLFMADRIGNEDDFWTVDGVTLIDITMEATTGNSQGVFWHNSDEDFVLKNVYARNLSFTGVEEQSCGGILKTQAGRGAFEIEDVDVSGVTFSGACASNALFLTTNESTLTRANVSDCRRLNLTGGQAIGLLGVASGNAGDLTITDSTVRDCHTFYGMGGYGTNAGVIRCKRVAVIDCSDGGIIGDFGNGIEGLAFYSGGDGDCEFESCLVDGITQLTAERFGVAVYSHHVDRDSDTTKTTTIRNLTVRNVATLPTSSAVCVRVNYSGATHTANLTNVLIDHDGLGLEISEGDGTLDTTLDSCHINLGEIGGVVDEASTGTTDLGTLSTGDPRLDASGAPQRRSVATGGAAWWSGAAPLDLRGEPFPSWDISIGALQSTHQESHPASA